MVESIHVPVERVPEQVESLCFVCDCLYDAADIFSRLHGSSHSRRSRRLLAAHAIDFEVVNSMSNDFEVSLQRKGFPRRSEGGVICSIGSSVSQTKGTFEIANNTCRFLGEVG